MLSIPPAWWRGLAQAVEKVRECLLELIRNMKKPRQNLAQYQSNVCPTPILAPVAAAARSTFHALVLSTGRAADGTQTLLKYRLLNAFLLEQHPSAAADVHNHYVAIMRDFYQRQFARYSQQLSKLIVRARRQGPTHGPT